jgi:HSF-type DNA-binding
MTSDSIRVMRNVQEMINIVPRTVPSQCKFPRTGKRGVPQQFPRRLYEMLETETKNMETSAAYPSIISWSLSGKAFRIVNVSDFASVILPKYFRTTKFSSFQRNLNLVSVITNNAVTVNQYFYP